LTSAHGWAPEGGAVSIKATAMGDDGIVTRMKRDSFGDRDAVDTWDLFGGSQLRSEIEEIWNGRCSRSFEASKNSTREEKTDSTVVGGERRESRSDRRQRQLGQTPRNLTSPTDHLTSGIEEAELRSRGRGGVVGGSEASARGEMKLSMYGPATLQQERETKDEQPQKRLSSEIGDGGG
jgi:hypothetical protein